MSESLCMIARSGRGSHGHAGRVELCEDAVRALGRRFGTSEHEMEVRRIYDAGDGLCEVHLRIRGKPVSIMAGPGFMMVCQGYSLHQYFSLPAWAREAAFAVLDALGVSDAWACSEYVVDNCPDSIEDMGSLDGWLEHRSQRGIEEFDPQVHVCPGTSQVPPQICHDSFGDIRERNARILSQTGMEVVEGLILTCGWMLARKEGRLRIIDRDGHDVLGSHIDGYVSEDGMITVWRDGHSWRFTFMGDMLDEGDVPQDALECFTLEESACPDRRRRYCFIGSDGTVRHEYVV